MRGVKPKDDKRARLNIIADKIERGIVIFPKTGAELLIQQIVGFGVEKHDDLMDALTMAVIEILKGKDEIGLHYGCICWDVKHDLAFDEVARVDLFQPGAAITVD